MLRDAIVVAVRPRRGFAAVASARPLAPSLALVAGSGAASLLLSVAATFAEPLGGDESRAAGLGFSMVLPVLFIGFWLIDALIVDAVAQVMGVAARLRAWMAASAYAIPVLVAFGVVRLFQALLDRSGALDAATALGFVDFAVLGWFVVLVTIGVRAVYGLESLSAFAAALAPPAVMATLLVVLLVVGTALHGAGIG